MPFLEMEGIVERLFEEIYPRQASGDRAIKPLLAPALGCAVVDPNLRQLLPNREYYKLDFTDFLEFATSSLPRQPRLGDFTNNELRFYDGFDLSPREPMMLASEFDVGVSILGATVARNEVFVSVTMRFSVQGTGFTQPFLVAMTFAPPKTDVALAEKASLQEWDRYRIYPPTSECNEWRFQMSGIYTDFLLEDMEKHPEREGAATLEQIAVIRSDADANRTSFATFFELARLGLHLPAYFDFMYDLVVYEEAQERIGSGLKSRGGSKDVSHERPNPSYRVVKSIRLIRVGAPHRSQRTWSAPEYRFSVRGHWRHYSSPTVVGHNPDGSQVLGRTWVRQYMKGLSLSVEDTESACAEPRVTIKIKQTLAYAEDVIGAHQQIGIGHSGPNLPGTRSEKPSEEWKAIECSKLTAGLRYAVMRRDGFRCRLCGRSASEENGVRLEVDHMTPVAQWGPTTEQNLQTLCQSCNRGKANTPSDDPSSV